MASKSIVVAGGGFAGVWAAAAAARVRQDAGLDENDIRVSLISKSSFLEIRPRLYEASPDTMKISLKDILGPAMVEYRICEIVEIETNTSKPKITLKGGETIEADQLVLATGSQLVRPNQKSIKRILFDIDTVDTATQLDDHIKSLANSTQEGQWTVVVVGSGFTGTELATELPSKLRAAGAPEDEIRVVVVERSDVIAPELGATMRPTILDAFDNFNIELKLSSTVESADSNCILLSNGDFIASQTLVWTAGMRASPLATAIGANVDELGRLRVDRFLAVDGVANTFAAGDVATADADNGHCTLQSCQHAQMLGRFAGYNAATKLVGGEPMAYSQPFYVTCLDLGEYGALLSYGWDRKVVRTGKDAKKIKELINQRLIYPPQNDASALLAAAAPMVREAEDGIQRLLSA